MKRMILGFIAIIMVVAAATYADAETEKKRVVNKAAYEFCAVEKEKRPVLHIDAKSKEEFCFKCVYSKDGKWYPEKTDCPDDKNNK